MAKIVVTVVGKFALFVFNDEAVDNDCSYYRLTDMGESDCLAGDKGVEIGVTANHNILLTHAQVDSVDGDTDISTNLKLCDAIVAMLNNN